MRKLILQLLMLMVTLFAVCSAQGKTSYQVPEELKSDAERGFAEILDLWHNGRYDELYDRTLAGGKQTKEGFIGRMSSASLRPVCCWEKLQDVRVTLKNDESVVLRAKVGLEGSVGNSFKTRDYRLVKEDGVWRIAQADLLSLSGAAKKKVPHKKKSKIYRSL
jgi:hypothetical protein